MKFNSIAQSSLMVLSLLLTAAGAHAQSAARANVPFAFKVGTTQMPAGTYAIQNGHGSNVVTVRNVQTGASALALGRQESPSRKTDKLIFHRYGSQYFLTAILGGRGSDAMVLPASKQEKELQIANASENSGANIEIASR
jgi:hypothetical protein